MPEREREREENTDIMYLQVVSACIPTYAPYFRAFASNLSSSYRHNTASNTASKSKPNSRSKRKTYALATRLSNSKSSAGRSAHSRGIRTDTDTGTGTGVGMGSSNTHSQLNEDYDLAVLDDGTTFNKGSGHSTTIMSTSMPGGRGRHGDSDSEELIRDRGLGQGDENGFGHEHGYGIGHGHRHEGDGRSVTPPDASMEDPFQIHTMTEFKVERHNV